MTDLRARFRVGGARIALHFWGRLTAPVRHLEAVVRAVDDRLFALTTLRPGTRVRLTGRCCTVGRKHKGEMATITKWKRDIFEEDYHVVVDGKEYRWDDGRPQRDGHDYACERGFDVVEYR